jgi:hypothetical protein
MPAFFTAIAAMFGKRRQKQQQQQQPPSAPPPGKKASHRLLMAAAVFAFIVLGGIGWMFHELTGAHHHSKYSDDTSKMVTTITADCTLNTARVDYQHYRVGYEEGWSGWYGKVNHRSIKADVSGTAHVGSHCGKVSVVHPGTSDQSPGLVNVTVDPPRVTAVEIDFKKTLILKQGSGLVNRAQDATKALIGHPADTKEADKLYTKTSKDLRGMANRDPNVQKTARDRVRKYWADLGTKLGYRAHIEVTFTDQQSTSVVVYTGPAQPDQVKTAAVN